MGARVIYAFDDFELDTATFELRQAGAPCALEPQVFELLRYLVEHHDRLVSKDELLDHIWPERFITEAALNSRLMSARKIIGDNGREQRLIRTLHGRGYRFVGDVRTVSITEPPPPTVPAAHSGEPAILAAADPVRIPVVADKPGRVEAPPPPTVRYAPTPDGALSIAYTVIGQGPPLIRVPGWFTHLDVEWNWPRARGVWTGLAEDFSVVRYDGRGMGLSDAAEEFSADTRIADLEAVIETLGLGRFALLGIAVGGAGTAIRYAAANPGRVTHLVTHGGGVNIDDRYAHRQWVREWEMHIQVMARGWGKDSPIYRRLLAELLLGSEAGEDDIDALVELHRLSSPARRAARRITTSNDNEAPSLAALIRVPSLITHTRDDAAVPLQRSQRLAALIPGARMLVLPGSSHLLLDSSPAFEGFHNAVREFVLPADRA
jgi:DNA-binding winged helix-turn-helix (wHTH) protein/alpha-beta hydrolase superfamily lysophospholipase